jgi:eukaryotic-like serine/threonine-protein kinase
MPLLDLERTRTFDSQRAEPTDSELQAWLDARIGRHYRIVKHLASGGMGHVFLCRHTGLGVPAAVKVVPFDASPQVSERILAEAELLSELEHPNIVRLLEVGSLDDESPYLLMEFVPGSELSRPVDGGRTLAVQQTLRVLDQAAGALDYLHERGIVHRDVKPQNLLLDARANSAVKLIDFGIAVRTGGNTFDFARALAGTPGYMAPEQAAGASCSPAVDRYALGALALELLTGRPPRAASSRILSGGGATFEPPMYAHGRGRDAAALDAVFARALAREPEARFGSARELVWELRRALAPSRPQPRAAETFAGSAALA